MPRAAIVVFTGRPMEQMLAPDIRGSGDWRLDLARAEAAEFLICTRNRHSPDFPPTPEPHRAAFLIGRTEAIVRSFERNDRWLIRISEYTACLIPNVWGKSGQTHLRYPVWYTTVEDLGIDLTSLPPFQPVPQPGGAAELAEAAAHLLAPPRPWAAQRQRPPHQFGPPTSARLDAILAQLDRIPDLPVPADPPDWDEHGVPR